MYSPNNVLAMQHLGGQPGMFAPQPAPQMFAATSSMTPGVQTMGGPMPVNSALSSFQQFGRPERAQGFPMNQWRDARQDWRAARPDRMGMAPTDWRAAMQNWRMDRPSHFMPNQGL